MGSRKLSPEKNLEGKVRISRFPSWRRRSIFFLPGKKRCPFHRGGSLSRKKNRKYSPTMGKKKRPLLEISR